MTTQLAQTTCGKTLTFDLGTEGEHILECFSQARELADAALKELARHGLYWRTTTVRLLSMSTTYMERTSSLTDVVWRFSAFDSCSLWEAHREHAFVVRTRWHYSLPRPAAVEPAFYGLYGD
jgi:hypothetical protein